MRVKRVEDKIGGLQPPGLQHPPTTGMDGRIGIRRIKKNTLKMRYLMEQLMVVLLLPLVIFFTRDGDLHVSE